MAEPSAEQNPDAPPLPQTLAQPGGGHYAEQRKALDDAIPWIEYAVQQAQLYKKTVEDAVENAVTVSKDRLDRIRTTSSAHFNQTLDSLQDVKSEYDLYEDAVFGKIKEGILVAASHPLATTGAVFGLGFLGLKRPRRFLYYSTMRLFASEESNILYVIVEMAEDGPDEALLSKADARVKELRKTIDLLKAEHEKVEKAASQAEEELTRGRMKLKQAGKQIQSVIRSAYKIERQAGGLKDVLKELPRREASRFRSEVSNLASEAKRERSALTKEVTKISNYGISV